MSQESLREALHEAEAKLKEYEEVFKEFEKGNYKFGTIINIGTIDRRATVAIGSDVVIVPLPLLDFEIGVGDTVAVATEGGVIVKKLDPLLVGTPLVVKTVMDKLIEVTGSGGTKIVLKSDTVPEVKPGDKVLCDSSGLVLIHKWDNDLKETFDMVENVNVSWEDIGGQDEAKEAVELAISLPKKHPEVFKHYKRAASKGILLSGPPGCGKTLVAKAIATELNAEEDNKTGSFMYVKATEILDPYVGVAEANVRNLFNRAHKFKEITGKSAIIFIDEAEAILGVRGGRYNQMEKTIVPSFLTEMDGLTESSAIVILATNRPQDLDPAITREGRIDTKIAVKRPDRKASRDILRLYLNKVPVCKSVDMDVLVTEAVDSMFSPDKVLCKVEIDGVIGTQNFTMGDITSGSGIKSIVDKATEVALKRDLASKSKKPTGVQGPDVMVAINSLFIQNLEVNHIDSISMKFEGKQIKAVRKVNYA